MSVIEQLQQDVAVAMKSGDKAYLSALRMLLAAVQTAEKEHGRSLTEEQEVAVLAREKARRQKTAATFRSLGQDERARREEAEARVIERYLPTPGMSDEELDQLIEGVIAETGATGMSDMGTVMSRVMPQVGHRLEGAQVSTRVRQFLSGQMKPRPKP